MAYSTLHSFHIALPLCWILEVLGDHFAAFHELDRIGLAAKADRVFGELVDFSPVRSAVGDDRHESAPRFGNKPLRGFRASRELTGYRLRVES